MKPRSVRLFIKPRCGWCHAVRKNGSMNMGSLMKPLMPQPNRQRGRRCASCPARHWRWQLMSMARFTDFDIGITGKLLEAVLTNAELKNAAPTTTPRSPPAGMAAHAVADPAELACTRALLGRVEHCTSVCESAKCLNRLGMLEQGHGDFHDSRRSLHSRLRFLRGDDSQTAGPGI